MKLTDIRVKGEVVRCGGEDEEGIGPDTNDLSELGGELELLADVPIIRDRPSKQRAPA